MLFRRIRFGCRKGEGTSEAEARRSYYHRSVSALLTHLEVLRFIHGTPRVRPAVIGDDLEFVRKNIRNGGIRTSVSPSAWDYEEWPPYSAQFKIERIAFGCYAL